MFFSPELGLPSMYWPFRFFDYSIVLRWQYYGSLDLGYLILYCLTISRLDQENGQGFCRLHHAVNNGPILKAIAWCWTTGPSLPPPPPPDWLPASCCSTLTVFWRCFDGVLFAKHGQKISAETIFLTTFFFNHACSWYNLPSSRSLHERSPLGVVMNRK